MKEVMTIPEIGPEEAGSLYRDLEGYDSGIIYYDDPESKFLIRQVTRRKEDIELVRQSRKYAARNTRVWVQDKKGNKMLMQIDALGGNLEDSDEELLEKINMTDPEKNEDGSVALFVFNKYTKEFIASLDVEPYSNGDFDTAKILFTFSIVPGIEKKFGKKLRMRIKDILITSGMYTKCNELYWNGNQYILKPI